MIRGMLSKLAAPLSILAEKVSRSTANKVVLLLCAGAFFIMVAVAYNIIFRGELPSRGAPTEELELIESLIELKEEEEGVTHPTESPK